jgi:hypothetical protein
MEETRRYASRLTSFSRPLPPVGWHDILLEVNASPQLFQIRAQIHTLPLSVIHITRQGPQCITHARGAHRLTRLVSVTHIWCVMHVSDTQPTGVTHTPHRKHQP